MNVVRKHMSLERSGMLSSEEKLKGNITHRNLTNEKNWIYKTVTNRVDVYQYTANINTYILSTEILNIVVRNLDTITDNLQLYGDACHLIVSKMLEMVPINKVTLVEYSRDKYTSEELLNAELQIFELLNFNTYLPVSSYFSYNYMEGLGIEYDHVVNDYAKFYYSMFSIYDKDNRLLPSIIAISSIYLALMNFNSTITVHTLSELSGYFEDEIIYVASKISETYKRGYNSKYRYIFTHFTDNTTVPVYNLYAIKHRYLNDKNRILRPQYKRRESISFKDEDVVRLKKTGKGAYSDVYLVEYKNQHKALKEFAYDDEGLVFDTIRELSLLRTFFNSNIIDLGFVDISFTHDTKILTIMEYIEYDLMHVIDSDDDINIQMMKRYSLQLFNAVKYIHDLGIIHGDIKPQNIMVKGEDIKLIDFGTSEVYTGDNIPKPTTGSTQYRAVEMFFTIKYTESVDIWSCGVVIAGMVRGNDLFKVKGIYEDFDYHIEQLEELLGTHSIQTFKEDYGKSEDYTWKYYLSEDEDLQEFFKTDDELLIRLLMETIALQDDRLTIDECIDSAWLATR